MYLGGTHLLYGLDRQLLEGTVMIEECESGVTIRVTGIMLQNILKTEKIDRRCLQHRTMKN